MHNICTGKNGIDTNTNAMHVQLSGLWVFGCLFVIHFSRPIVGMSSPFRRTTRIPLHRERKKTIPKYTFRGLFIYLSACVYVFGSVIDRDVRESEKFTALLQVTYVFQYFLIYIYMNETAMPQR